jgi:hypothetical protein
LFQKEDNCFVFDNVYLFAETGITKKQEYASVGESTPKSNTEQEDPTLARFFETNQLKPI